jgi:hypothetical protein
MAQSKSKDAQSLTRDEAVKLYEGIRAVESIAADIKDLQDDLNQRKTLITEELPIQKDVLDFVLKRRKHSKGIVNNFDTMLQLVEEALAEVESEHAEEVRDRIKDAAARHGQADLLEDEDESDGELAGEPAE